MDQLGRIRQRRIFFKHIVLYADASEVGPGAVPDAVQHIADMGTRAILVVDNCPAELHGALSGMVAGSHSRLSLVTIDYDTLSGATNENTFVMNQSSPAVTQAMINNSQGLSQDDQHWIARFSEGFPGICSQVIQAWTNGVPLGKATDDNFVDSIVLGRNPRRVPQSLLGTAALIAACGPIQANLGPTTSSAETSRRLTRSSVTWPSSLTA